MFGIAPTAIQIRTAAAQANCLLLRSGIVRDLLITAAFLGGRGSSRESVTFPIPSVLRSVLPSYRKFHNFVPSWIQLTLHRLRNRRGGLLKTSPENSAPLAAAVAAAAYLGGPCCRGPCGPILCGRLPCPLPLLPWRGPCGRLPWRPWRVGIACAAAFGFVALLGGVGRALAARPLAGGGAFGRVTQFRGPCGPL